MSTCPLTGETECHGCKFYQKTYTTEYMCLFEAQLSHLNEMCNNLRILVDSSEQHRETHVQFIKSGMKKEPTDELLKLTGLKEH